MKPSRHDEISLFDPSWLEIEQLRVQVARRLPGADRRLRIHKFGDKFAVHLLESNMLLVPNGKSYDIEGPIFCPRPSMSETDYPTPELTNYGYQLVDRIVADLEQLLVLETMEKLAI